MTFTLILEGSNNVGKTTISEQIEQWFNQLGINYTYFHDTDLYESIMEPDGTFSVEELMEVRHRIYSELREEYDVILLDRSFMSTIVYNLGHLNDNFIYNYIDKEILNLEPYPFDRVMIYVLVRDSHDLNTDSYVKLSHNLLLKHNVNSNVWFTNEDLKRTFNIIKEGAYNEMVKLGLVEKEE